jgi:hypothetical protein
MFENATETLEGFIWEPLPADIQSSLSCVSMQDLNFDNFNTGYSQFVLNANHLTANCTDTITLTRYDGDVDVITIYVEMAECPAPDVPCVDGETIQNLYIWNCACEPLAPVTGVRLIDDSIHSLDTEFFRGEVNDSVTIR